MPKPLSVLRAYKEIFAPLKGCTLTLLELGVQDGESLDLWTEMFPHAKIIGVDILNREYLTRGNVTVMCCEQTDPEILKHGPFDIIIDDGSHMMSDQQKSFQLLYPSLNPGGLYIIEDIETSYWGEFQDTSPTTVEFMKERIDDLQVNAMRNGRCGKGHGWSYRREHELTSITFYENLCVIRK